MENTIIKTTIGIIIGGVVLLGAYFLISTVISDNAQIVQLNTGLINVVNYLNQNQQKQTSTAVK